MATTFLKRQKEMKRQEKQREKAERRAQKKLANRMRNDGSLEKANSADSRASIEGTATPPESHRQD
jgi:hypothetical protein